MGYWGMGCMQSDTALDFEGDWSHYGRPVEMLREAVFKQPLDDISDVTKLRVAAYLCKKHYPKEQEIINEGIRRISKAFRKFRRQLKWTNEPIGWKNDHEFVQALANDLEYLKTGREVYQPGLWETILTGEAAKRGQYNN